MLDFLLFVMILLLLTAGPVVAVFYASRALGWGLHRHPVIISVVTCMAVFLLACSFGWLFPGCRVTGATFHGVATVLCQKGSVANQARDPSLPDAKMIARIEDLAKNSVAEANYNHAVNLKNIPKFDRFYAFTTNEGRQLVWGELYPGGRGELHIVHKNEVRYVFDGGCVAVTLFYDIKAEKFAGLYCHGLA